MNSILDKLKRGEPLTAFELDFLERYVAPVRMARLAGQASAEYGMVSTLSGDNEQDQTLFIAVGYANPPQEFVDRLRALVDEFAEEVERTTEGEQ